MERPKQFRALHWQSTAHQLHNTFISKTRVFCIDYLTSRVDWNCRLDALPRRISGLADCQSAAQHSTAQQLHSPWLTKMSVAPHWCKHTRATWKTFRAHYPGRTPTRCFRQLLSRRREETVTLISPLFVIFFLFIIWGWVQTGRIK